ncbi:MAG: cation diffusion facilitator family transporter, partial [Kiritimatiellia bacterium]
MRLFVRDFQRVDALEVRERYVRLESWISILGNTFLGTTKLVFGMLTGSIALSADAVHTYGDMLSSAVILVSMRIAATPPDDKHPHGHGRAEAIGTLLVAAMLIVAAIEFAQAAVRQFFYPSPKLDSLAPKMEIALIILLLLFWVFKEWMARFSADLGRRIGSEALGADAQHHRSDALATLLVVCSLFSTRLGYPWADGIFGLGVAAFIGWAGIGFALRMMSQLMGEAPSRKLIDNIFSAASSIKGVRGVRGITVHDYGSYKVASLQIEVAGNTNTADSHQLATLVEESISRRLGLSAVVHVEVHRGTESSSDFRRVVEETLR